MRSAAFDERRRRGDRALDAVHVSEVRLAPDFRQANVYWHLDAAETAARAPPSRFFGDPLRRRRPGPEDAAAPRRRAEAALARAAPALRIAVARRALRFATDLRFQYDAPARRSPDHLGAGLGRDLDDGAA
ncbi:S-methyl-5-thioribose kinase [Aureococcus anophagefferens]|nr:S-methyl-5-thioribose kinase [Aureococcus anophagefferens]